MKTIIVQNDKYKLILLIKDNDQNTLTKIIDFDDDFISQIIQLCTNFEATIDVDNETNKKAFQKALKNNDIAFIEFYLKLMIVEEFHIIDYTPIPV